MRPIGRYGIGLWLSAMAAGLPAVVLAGSPGDIDGVVPNSAAATSGIDVRFAHSSAVIDNNLLSGRIRNRDGGSHAAAGNLVEIPVTTFADWFVDPVAADFRFRDARELRGQAVDPAPVDDDFCGRTRAAGAADIGAITYADGRPCDTTAGGGGHDRRFFGGFDG